MTLWEVDIYPADGQPDLAGRQAAADALDLGLPQGIAVHAARGYLLEGAVDRVQVDRLARRYVIDFIEWHWFNRPDLVWPSFNLADSFLSVGMRYKGKAIGALRVYTDTETQFPQIQIGGPSGAAWPSALSSHS